MSSTASGGNGVTSPDAVNPSTTRDYDIMVYGIGYTGKQVCHQLIRRSKADGLQLRIAVSARNKEKLDAFESELSSSVDAEDNITISTFVIGLDAQIPKESSGLLDSDAGNPSLLSLISRSEVCIATAGPYRDCAEVIVRCCIRGGTHYVDCNGEPDYSSVMARKYWDEAKAQNVLLVYSAGFDSVPVDMGCFRLQQEHKPVLGIQAFVRFHGNPELSHGTTKTLIDAMAQAKLKVPDGPEDRPIPSNAPRLKLFNSKQHTSDVTRGAVKLRMVPDANNVLWSYKLQHGGSLEGFEYAQYQCLDGDQVEDNFGCCFFCCLGFCMALGCLKCECCRNCVKSVHGAEGSGPAKADVDATHVEVTMQAVLAEPAEPVTVVAETDEMYVFTAQALAEAGLCLRYDYEQLPMKGGHAPPAAALGAPYLKRLEENKLLRFTDK